MLILRAGWNYVLDFTDYIGGSMSLADQNLPLDIVTDLFVTYVMTPKTAMPWQ